MLGARYVCTRFHNSNKNYDRSINLDNLPKFDIIFNTADAPLLENCETSALIIDLSTTGCIDETKVASGNYNYLKAPSLPGKTAPITAGKILAETVAELIRIHN